jgi:hypothetical protein
MERKLLSYILLLLAWNAFSQTAGIYLGGVYMSLEQFRNRTPQFHANLEVIRRTQSDIAFNGGNDYELKSNNDSLNRSFIKKKMFAYVKNDSIFLNCLNYQLSTWYALILTRGNYMAFKGAMSNSRSSQEVSPYGVMFGAIGGGIAGANAAKKRFLYVLSLRTGNVRELTKEYLIQRLKENQESLLEQYNAEKEPESEEVLLHYINLLNETVSPVSTSPKTEEEKKK